MSCCGKGDALFPRLVLESNDLIAEYNGSGVLQKRYVHGPGLDEPLVWYEGAGTGDRRYLLADERGSVIGVVSNAGTVTVNKYDEYGAPAAGNQGRFQYTGQIWLAELGLYHYKARAYHPRLGRFLQPDPIGTAGGMNLYGYVGNDPINRRDPSGLCAWGMNTITQTTTFTDYYQDKILIGHTVDTSLSSSFECLWDIPVPYIGPPDITQNPQTPGSLTVPDSTPPVITLPESVAPPDECDAPLPDGSTVRQNVRGLNEFMGSLMTNPRASDTAYFVTVGVWIGRVWKKSDWDYKYYNGGSEYQGNFNYGATGSLLFSDLILYSGAGLAQLLFDPEISSGGIPFLLSPYGDDTNDLPQIKAGIKARCR